MDFWKVLVVDGDSGSHAATAHALNRLVYRNRGVVIFEALNPSDARAVVSVHPDIAAVLVGFGRGEENAGRELIRWLRREKRNETAQILVLADGPVTEAEEILTLEYEIADYVPRAECTPGRIRTSLVSALRTYAALMTSQEQHEDLRRISEASALVFRNSGISEFERTALASIASFLHGPGNADRYFGVFATRSPDEVVPRITTATGSFRHLEGQKLSQMLNSPLYERVLSHNYAKGHLSLGKLRVYGFRIRDGSEVYLILEDEVELSDWNRDLLEGFRLQLGVALDNFHLFRGIESARDDLVFALGEMAESRSEETWNHVKRVAEIAHIMAQGMGMGEFETEQLRLAASLHDLGKLSIPEGILAKEGRLSGDEFESMKSHSLVGFEMLNTSNRSLFRTAAQIALEHHENWDGTGYPRGLKGEEINLYSRIVTVADVFDALGNRRAYKKPWNTSDILDFMRRETGRKFDPKVMEVFFERFEELNQVRLRFPD